MGEKFSWDRLLKRGKDNAAAEDNTIEIVQEAPTGLGPVAPLNASKAAPKPQVAPLQTPPTEAEKDRAPLVIDWSEYQQLEAAAQSAPIAPTAPAPVEVMAVTPPPAPPVQEQAVAPVQTPAQEVVFAAAPAPAQETPAAASTNNGFWEKLGTETNEAFAQSNAAKRIAEAHTEKPQIAGWDDVDLTPSEKSMADPVTNSISVPEHTPKDPKAIEEAIQSIATSSAWDEAPANPPAPVQPQTYTPIEFSVPVQAVEPPVPVFEQTPVAPTPPVEIPAEPTAAQEETLAWNVQPVTEPIAPPVFDVPAVPEATYDVVLEPEEAAVPVVEAEIVPPVDVQPVIETVAPPMAPEAYTAPINTPLPPSETFQWPVMDVPFVPEAVPTSYEAVESIADPTPVVSETVMEEVIAISEPVVVEPEFQLQNPWEIAESENPLAGFNPVQQPPEAIEVTEVIKPINETAAPLEALALPPVEDLAPVIESVIEPEVEEATEVLAYEAPVIEPSEVEAPIQEIVEEPVPIIEQPPVAGNPAIETVQSTGGNFWDTILSPTPAQETESSLTIEDQPVLNAVPVRSDLPEEYTHIDENHKQEEVAKDSRIGELLVNHKLVSQGQIERAIKRQSETNEKLGQILISMGIMTERRLLQVLAAQKGVSPWHLEEDRPSQDAIRLIPQEMCRVFQMLPVAVRGDLLLLAMRDTSDAEAIEAVRLHTKKRVEPVLADEARLAFHIDRAFGVAASRNAVAVDEIVQNALETIAQQAEDEEPLEPDFHGPNTIPVNALVNQIVLDAIHSGASDVHLEPSHNKVEVRYRINGRLNTVRELPLELSDLVVARLKYIGHLDVNETMVPQSGRVSADFANHAVDFKISVLPNPHGARIVLRLLDRSLGLKTLDELGFETENLKMFRELINKPYGLFVIAGPTGNGKTTTLYSALSELQDSGLNIMTCEDPIEFDLVGINQIEVDRARGLSFATQLQAILEQDPDVILVGEIRDRETAEIAVRSAISGKKVFATLDTNDAAGAIPRLLELGVDPAILSTALTGIMSQRLLRCLSQDSKTQSEATADEKSLLRSAFGIEDVEEVWRATPDGESDGYKGRCAAHEILPITPDIARLIAEQATCEEIKNLAGFYGYLPIQYDALTRILNGQTTLDEARKNIAFDTFEKRESPRHLNKAS